MYTLEECEKNWIEAGAHGTPAERIARSRRWLEYYGYLARSELSGPYKYDGKLNPLVGGLLSMGILRLNDTVLDIGAGMGNYTLDIAKYTHRVTALDPSKESLEVMEQRAALRHIQNIEYVNSMWEQYQPEQKFDVCFSAMCPAICDPAELRRMEAMTARSCALVTVMRGSYDKHRRQMMEQLGVKPRGGMTTEAIHYINTLYFMGRQPNVRCRTIHMEHSIPINTVMEQYPIYFKIFGVNEDVSVPFLERYLKVNAVKGYLTEESCMNLAIICWNVSAGV